MTVSAVLDSAGRRRSPATLPRFHAGRPPRNKGMRYPADPPTVEEIIAVMRNAGDNRHGWRLRALIVVLWRGGLRIQEALALAEPDLDPRRGSLLVRNGKGGRRAVRSGWTPGDGSNCAPGSPLVAICLSGHCSASSTVRRAGAHGRVPPCASSFVDSPARQGCDAGSRHTSYVMPMRSSSPGRAYR